MCDGWVISAASSGYTIASASCCVRACAASVKTWQRSLRFACTIVATQSRLQQLSKGSTRTRMCSRMYGSITVVVVLRLMYHHLRVQTSPYIGHFQHAREVSAQQDLPASTPCTPNTSLMTTSLWHCNSHHSDDNMVWLGCYYLTSTGARALHRRN